MTYNLCDHEAFRQKTNLLSWENWMMRHRNFAYSINNCLFTKRTAKLSSFIMFEDQKKGDVCHTLNVYL